MDKAIMLTVAGSDSGGGAGIQADIKTAMAHGVYAASVVTAVTAQNTVSVSEVFPVPPAIVAAQLEAVFSDFQVAVVKVGLLPGPAWVEILADAIVKWAPPAVVVDPVGTASVGVSLQAPQTLKSMIDHLFPRATVLTPNLDEALALCREIGAPAWVGPPVDRAADGTIDACDDVARLASLANAMLQLGPRFVLAKGGHLAGNLAVDVLASAEGQWRWSVQKIVGRSGHGTGCTLASAIAARLVRGACVPDAVSGAKRYLTAALEASSQQRLGQGVGPLAHPDAPR